MTLTSLPPAHFDALYAADPDPWRFATNPYEHAKYDDTLAALGERRFVAALEVGCSIGVLTSRLAPRCDLLLAIDVAEAALAAARARCAGQAHVRFARIQVPREWPAGRFDLILLSEIVYYFAPADLASLAARVRGSLAPGGSALLVAWLGPTGAALSGDAASDGFIAATGLAPMVQLRRPGYRLDLLQAGGAR